MNVLEILTCAAMLRWMVGGAYVVMVAKKMGLSNGGADGSAGGVRR